MARAVVRALARLAERAEPAVDVPNIDPIRAMATSHAARAKILGGNAARLLKLT